MSLRAKANRTGLRNDSGQASVEFVAILPLVVLVSLACWQMAVAGHSVWLLGGAASAAARAQAVTGTAGSVLGAAKSKLPNYLKGHVRVAKRRDDGTVKLDLDIPGVVGGDTLTTIHATAQFAPQAG